MNEKLYAEELLKKLNDEKELKILKVIWDDNLPIDKKIETLLREESNCSSSK
jgi:hypothetical protein